MNHSTTHEAARRDLMGLVLAGGRSSRMGVHKAGLALPDGRTFLEGACAAVRPLCHEMCVSWHDMAWYAVDGARTIFDQTAEIGPLGGLCAGLGEAAREGYDGVVVLPCDTPLVDTALLARLVEAWLGRGREHMACCFRGRDGRLHPLVAVWDVRALPFALMAAASEDWSMRHVLPKEGWLAVPCGEDEERRLVNVNTRTEYEVLLARMAAAGPADGNG